MDRLIVSNIRSVPHTSGSGATLREAVSSPFYRCCAWYDCQALRLRMLPGGRGRCRL